MRVLTSKEFPKRPVLDCSASENLITLEFQDKVVVQDQKNNQFTIEKEVVVTQKIPTQEYIDSFKDDVGIENIMKKFLLTKDESLFQQVARPSVPIDEDGKQEVQDYTGIPSEEEALKLFTKAKTEFAKLPNDLVKNRSFVEFAESCSKEELVEFMQSIISKKAAKEAK